MIPTSPVTSGLHLDVSNIAPEEYLYHLQRIQKTLEILDDEFVALGKQFDDIVAKCNQLNIKENDFVYLKCKATERRSVHIPSFVALFPEAAKTHKEEAAIKMRLNFNKELDELVENGLTKIRVEDAENLVGKIPLQKAVVISRTESYSIIEKNQNRE